MPRFPQNRFLHKLHSPPPQESVNYKDFLPICTDLFSHLGFFGGVKPICGQTFYGHPDSEIQQINLSVTIFPVGHAQ